MVGNLEAGVPSATNLGKCLAVVSDGHRNQCGGLLLATAVWRDRSFGEGAKGGLIASAVIGAAQVDKIVM